MEPLENFEKVIKRKDLLRFQDERGEKIKYQISESLPFESQNGFSSAAIG